MSVNADLEVEPTQSRHQHGWFPGNITEIQRKEVFQNYSG